MLIDMVKRSRLPCTSKHILKRLRLKHGSDPDSDFDKRQLAMGVKVEMEHINCPILAKQISKAHLAENPRYYTFLEALENLVKQVG